jgi:hypothetical protein
VKMSYIKDLRRRGFTATVKEVFYQKRKGM